MDVTLKELDDLVEGHGLLLGGVGKNCKKCYNPHPCVTVRSVKELKNIIKPKKRYKIVNSESFSDLFGTGGRS